MSEGADVYFECNIKANPWVYRVAWRHNVRNFTKTMMESRIKNSTNRRGTFNPQDNDNELQNNPQEGIIISNQSLVLQNITRQRLGQYICTASNSEGDGFRSVEYL